MPSQPNGTSLKAAVSVSEMSRLVGMSRARFYDYIRNGTFPPPVYDSRTRRPIYTADLQRLCISVRTSGLAWKDGGYVVFYRRAPKPTDGGSRKRKGASKVSGVVTELVDALGQLGLTVSQEQAAEAVAELFPEGLQNCGGEEIRKVFCHLRRPNSV